MQKSAKKADEAIQLAAEESAKSRAGKEVIKSLTAQVTLRLSHLSILSGFIFLQNEFSWHTLNQ